MSTIKAIDGATISFNGGSLVLPLPVGTSIMIHKGGLLNSGAEEQGNLTAVIQQKKATGIFKGIICSIIDTDNKAAFEELCTKQGISAIISNGETSYRIAKGSIMSPSEDSSVGFDSSGLKTEAFDFKSQQGGVETL